MKIISEKEIVRFFDKEAGRPMSTREIISQLGVPESDRSAIRRLLRRMGGDGLLIRLKKGRYALPSQMKLITGKVIAHPDGYGFMVPDEDQDQHPDLFISPRKMKEVMHGDRVICRVDHSDGKKAEGSIVRIIERGQIRLVGTLDRTRDFSYVIPVEKRIPWDVSIPDKLTAGAKRGQAVLVEITRYPTKSLPPEGKIVEVLGDPDDPEVELQMIIRKNGLPDRFQPEVMEEAGNIALKIPAKEIKKRFDLRDQTLFTIDGETAKDFDDAVSIEKKSDGGFRLGVHIADVSLYVKVGTALDNEALERGTSVYLPDRAIPMLPEELSNGICSLRPHEDRLTLSCFMEFDSKGRRLGFELRDTVINSDARLTYTEVAAILEGKREEFDNAETIKEPGRVKDDLFIMKELALLLNRERARNGSVDFDLPEPDIILDIRGRIESILKADRNIAHKIIEEFMLAANVSVAEFLESKKITSVYRVHEPPSEADILSLKEFVYNLGFTIPAPDTFKAKDLRDLLSLAADKPQERLINHVALRSMKQAVYSVENIGHFCLAFPAYTHFTSPIRRYPDLIIHRLIRWCKKKGKAGKENKKSRVAVKPLKEVAALSSELARRAEDTEREVVQLKKVQFMSDRAGETFDAYISGVASFGLFVELNDLFVEGMVHVSSMSDDYYIYQEKQISLVGQRKKRVFRICDKVRVKLVGVSLERLRIDFELVGKK